MVTLRALIQRDLLLWQRQKSYSLLTLGFYGLILFLIQFGLSPIVPDLTSLLPTFLWLSTMMGVFMSTTFLFHDDVQDGTLLQLTLSSTSLPLLMGTHCFIHWLSHGLLLVLITPLLGFILGLDLKPNLLLTATLLPGTLALTFLGGICASLLVGLRHSTTLLFLLSLPFYLPILILGLGTLSIFNRGGEWVFPLLALMGLAFVLLITAPWLIAYQLRAVLKE